MAGQAKPVPPIAIDAPTSRVRHRFGDRGVDVDGRLLERLRAVCAKVDVDDESRVDAGRDWWPLAILWATAGTVPARPAVVVRPTDATEVSAVLALCNEAGVPVTPMAGRSGVCGASVPVFGGVSLDLCELRGVVAVDDVSLVVDVRAGTFGVDLEAELRTKHGVTLGHWPQSVDLSTVGGWLACRSAGQYSTRYGKIEDMVVGLDVVLADGTTVHTGGWPRAATGPDLTQLFVGSEGTLGVITGGRLRAHPVPSEERRLAFGFASFGDGLEACRRTLRRGATPAVLRLYDEVESARNFGADDTCVLIVLDEGDAVLVEATARVVAEECERGDAESLDATLVERWLEHRNDVSALAALARRHIVVDTIEIAARWAALLPIYEDAVARLRSLDGTLAASAHQSHAYGDGACVYFTFAGQGPTPDDLGWAEAYYAEAWRVVMEATTAHGGAISHHHGVGLNRARFLAPALGDAFATLVDLKAALDPNG
ncbi:MAG TPA: FAD-binding oxidoreductase, partial [Acidimicrobiales bacterium]|nr:FAD-binding oxidoreductase [Acidimicrobiales bacterium]